MSTGRIVWITFCLGWVGFWIITLLFGNVFALALAPMSALATLIPIGKTPRIVARPYLNSVPSSMDDPRFTTEYKEHYFDNLARNTAVNIYPR